MFPQHVSELSSFPPPPMPVFHWNPGCLYPGFIILSFLEPGLVCFNFYLLIPPHLIQTIHIQPCLLICTAECEPLGPGTSLSISKHRQAEDVLSLHPIPHYPCHQDPSSQHCKLLKSSGLEMYHFHVILSQPPGGLLGIVFIRHV